MAESCVHLDTITDAPPTATGCVECLAIGQRWVHLRRCTVCGHVGCCDASIGKHATKHFRATQHPVVQSFQPDESWYWCYADEVMFELD
jgi:uncharacterized UBP type Zn finger protein